MARPVQVMLIVLMVLMASSAPQAAAQQATQPTGKLPLPSPAATPPIAVQNILARADEDQQLINLARQLMAAPLPFERLQRGLDQIAKPVDAKLHTASGAALRELPIMRLESLARHWDFDASRYARWEAGARRAFAPYEDAAMQLAQRRLAWTATRAAGMLEGLPPAMSARVDTMLEQIDACEAALGAVLARQFDLTERASALMARIRTGTAEVAAAIDDIDRRLLRVDVPPLWQGLGTLGSSRASLDAVQRGLEIESRFARDYNAAGTGNQQALRVVQVLLLPLILGLVLRSRRRGAATANPTSALRRPWSAWVLLCGHRLDAVQPGPVPPAAPAAQDRHHRARRRHRRGRSVGPPR